MARKRKNASDPVKGATKWVMGMALLDALDEEYENMTAGMSQEEIEELPGPYLYVEFDEAGRPTDAVIDMADYYRGHSGPVAVITPGSERGDVERAIDDALSQHGAFGNPGGYEDFARRHGLTMKCKRLDTRPGSFDWPSGSSHWDCKIQRGKKSMKVIFSMGPALKGPPTVDDVVHSLAMDAGTWEQAGSAEGLADELGYEDMKEARKVWKSIESQTGRLQRLLDDPETYNELLYSVEENPIGNPMSPRMQAALAAGVGSLGGLILGGAIAGGLGAWMGSIAGGSAGGYLGSKGRARGGGAIGGALGGTLGPLGSGVGAYIGTYQENPDRLVVTADSEDEAERKARKFGRIVGVQKVGPREYHVVVASRHLNPGLHRKLTVRARRR